MTRYTIFFLFIIFSFSVDAQKNHFIYIQTETPQQFFIKIENAVKNASPSGYIIISELKAGKHEFTIGFPNTPVNDQKFEIQLNETDRSFLLKKFEDKGWGLFDLQEMSITQASNTQPGYELKPVEEVSAFTNVLAKASGDSTIKYKTVLEEKPKVANRIPDIKTDTTEKKVDVINAKPAATLNPASADVTKTVSQNPTVNSGTEHTKQVVTENQSLEPVNKPEVTSYNNLNYRPSNITRVSLNTTSSGTEIIFKDALLNGDIDTIKISIDEPVTQVAPVNVPQKPKTDLKFLDVTADKEVETEKSTGSEVKNAPAHKDSELQKNQCKVIASEKEVNQVRSKMALAVTDETMIIEAQKLFMKKCLTSSQVKRLSDLFVTNAGKYSFFNAVYDHVSDKQYFYTLRNELNDEHYKGRFLDILQK